MADGLKWRDAVDLRSRGLPDEIFDQIECGIPEEHRISGDPQIAMVLTPLTCADPRAFEWTDGIALMLTVDLVLVGRRGPGNEIEVRRWDHYGFLREHRVRRYARCARRLRGRLECVLPVFREAGRRPVGRLFRQRLRCAC